MRRVLLAETTGLLSIALDVASPARLTSLDYLSPISLHVASVCGQVVVRQGDRLLPLDGKL